MTEKKLFYSPFIEDLESRLVEEVRKEKDGDMLKPVVILVGSNFLRKYLIDRLAEEKLCLNVRVLLFTDLAREVARPEKWDKKKISPLKMKIIADNLLRAIPEKSYFGPISSKKGFRDAFLATSREVFEAGFFQPGEFQRLSAGVAFNDKDTALKIKEFAELHRAFRETIEKDGYDELVVFREAQASKISYNFIFGTSRLFVYGFYDFNRLQAAFLESIQKDAGIVFFMPYQPADFFKYAESGFNRLNSEGYNTEQALPADQDTRQGLRSLLGGLAGAKSQDPDTIRTLLLKTGTSCFQAHSVPGEERMSAEILREIFASVEKDSRSFAETLILCRTDDEKSLLAAFLKDSGIPVRVDGGVRISAFPYSKAVFKFLKILEGDYSRGMVLSYFDAAHPSSSFWKPYEDCRKYSLWEPVTANAGITGDSVSEWTQKAGRFDPGSLRKDRSEIKKTIRLILEFAADLSIPETASFGEYADSLKSLFDKYIYPDEKECTPEEAGFFSRLRTALEALPEAAGTFKAGIERSVFFGYVREILESLNIKTGFDHPSGVVVAPLMQARCVFYEMTFMPSLDSAMSPYKVMPDPILLDEERQLINQSAGREKALNLKSRSELEEDMLFLLGASTARKKLILLFSRIEELTGNPRLPSEYLLRLAQLLGIETTADTLFENRESREFFKKQKSTPVYLDEPVEALSEAELNRNVFAAFADKAGRGGASLAAEVLEGFKPSCLWFDNKNSRRFTPHDGALLPKKRAEGFIFPDCTTSFTAFREYLECPFRFFINKILKVRKFTVPEEVITTDRATFGNFAHKLLQQFYEEQKKAGRLPFTGEFSDEYYESFNNLFNSLAKEYAAGEPVGMPLAWRVASEDLYHLLFTYLEREFERSRNSGNPVPSHFEFKFKKSDSPHKPVGLSLKKNEFISIEGSIDRIDELDGRYVLIDYKTGKSGKKGDREELNKIEYLQLMLYMYCVSVLFKADKDKLGAKLVFLSEEKEDLLEEGFYPGKEEKLKEILSSVLEHQAAGRFIRMPDKEFRCKNCDYESICVSRDQEHERKKGDKEYCGLIELLESFG